jgi:protein-tyrosine phosphatase
MWTRKSELLHPGEYSKTGKPDGWARIVIPQLKQTLYFTSANFRKKLAPHYQIPSENIVSLIDFAPLSKHGIPEDVLPGPEGLAMFHERLQKLKPGMKKVLIHCQQGTNRTPVAAVLYLMSNNIIPQQAIDMVTKALKKRDPNFVLNKRGHYTQVLAEAEKLSRPDQHAAPPKRQKVCR